MTQEPTEKRYTFAGRLGVGSLSNPDYPQVVSKSTADTSSRGERASFQKLCEEIMELDDIETCTIINYHGAVIAQVLGETPENSDLETKGGSIAAVIWGGLKNVEPFEGPISFVSAIFEKAKFVGIPFPESRLAVILRVAVNMDTYHLKDIVSNYVRYWVQSNKPNSPQQTGSSAAPSRRRAEKVGA